jgi:AraC-like DNA-binding protein
MRVHLEAVHGHPLPAAIPPFIALGRGFVPAPRPLEAITEALIQEAAFPARGRSVVLTALCQALFVQALRVHMLELAWDDRGWFRALVDPLLGAPLEAAHRTAPAAMSVTQLAAEAGRSRRSVGPRFARYAGVKASEFVKQTRTRHAAALLRQGLTSLEAVALSSGFSRRQALCRAFRRELGTTPAAYWRRVHCRPFPRPKGRRDLEPAGPDPSP